MKKPIGKAPAFQWYPGDFRRDTAVQACSFEARSLWREMIDLMHDGQPRGHLTAGGVEIDLTQLARIVGVPVAKARLWLKELEERKVFSRTDEGVIYSRRMVKDEHISEVRRSSGKLGGNPDLVNQAAVQLDNQIDNQTGEQKPTPAVADCGLRTAVASVPLRPIRTESGSSGGSAPPDLRSGSEPQAILDRFLSDNYGGAGGKRLGDVSGQLRALAAGDVVMYRGQAIRAYGLDRLIRKVREVLDSPPKNRDRAIAVLLTKLGDTSDGSAPGERQAAALKTEIDRDEAINAWMRDPAHFADVDRIRDDTANELAGADPDDIETEVRRRIARQLAGQTHDANAQGRAS